MKMKNLNEALDRLMPPFFSDENRKEIIDAAKKDFDLASKGSEDINSWVLSNINSIFKSKYRVISVQVSKKYKSIFNNFSREEVLTAMNNAKNDDWHKQSNYKFCTPAYFSRIDQIDKWLNSSSKEVSSFDLPTFNIKE